jgi:hypothetical protein
LSERESVIARRVDDKGFEIREGILAHDTATPGLGGDAFGDAYGSG